MLRRRQGEDLVVAKCDLAMVWRFLSGFVAGLGGLGLLCAALFGAVMVYVDYEASHPEPPAGSPAPPEWAVVDGSAFSRLGGVDIQIGGNPRLRLTCNGVCDDLKFDGGPWQMPLRVLDQSGDCVFCPRRTPWIEGSDGRFQLDFSAADRGRR